MFFWLTRSLKYTIDNFRNNFFNILNSNNIEYDIYLHTYNLKVLTNTRSKEFNCNLDTEEYCLLNPCEFIIEDQDEFDKTFDYEKVKKYGDYYNDNFCSIYNLIRQLNSLKKVSSLIKKKNYDKYIFLRPDLLLENKFNINLIKKNYNFNFINTPSDQKWNGLNDRFAICNYYSFIKYSERIDYIDEYIKNYGKLHSERFLKFIINKFKIKNIDIDITLKRVRANNKIARNDLNL